MLENREQQPPILSPEIQVFSALEMAEGLCIRQIDKFIGFQSIVFEDWSLARAPLRPVGYNYHFYAKTHGQIGPYKGPFSSYDESANVMLSSLFCISLVRGRLARGLEDNPGKVNVRIVSQIEEMSQLEELAAHKELGKSPVLHGIRSARNNLFSTIVPEGGIMPSHSVETRPDGTKLHISTYQSAIPGVLWRVLKEGDVMDEYILINRK